MDWDFSVPTIRQRFERLYVCSVCGGRVTFPWDLAHGFDGKTPVCGRDRSHSGFVLATAWVEQERMAALAPRGKPGGSLDELF